VRAITRPELTFSRDHNLILYLKRVYIQKTLRPQARARVTEVSDDEDESSSNGDDDDDEESKDELLDIDDAIISIGDKGFRHVRRTT
jgi:hypothetical protein